MPNHRPMAGAYIFGAVIGIPAFMVVAKLFIWGVPALTRALEWAL